MKINKILIKYFLIVMCYNMAFNIQSMSITKELTRKFVRQEQKSKKIWFVVGFSLFLAFKGWPAFFDRFVYRRAQKNTLEDIVKNAKGSDLNQLFGNTTYDYTNPINQIPQEEQEKIKNVIEKYQDASAVLFMGPTGSGKTTIMVNIAKNAQKQGSTIYNFLKFSEEGAMREMDALRSVIKDAEQSAKETEKKSYILLNELHHFGFIAPSKNRFYYQQPYKDFLKLLENTEVRKYVRFLATTNDSVVDDLYIPERFDLEVLSKDKKSFDNIKKKYETKYPHRVIRINNILIDQ